MSMRRRHSAKWTVNFKLILGDGKQLQDFVDQAINGNLDKRVDYTVPEKILFNKVPVLSSVEFREKIGNNNFVLVKFFSEEDEKSRFLSVHFEDFAKEMEDLNVAVGAVDCLK